jgi:hypothetical protein
MAKISKIKQADTNTLQCILRGIKMEVEEIRQAVHEKVDNMNPVELEQLYWLLMLEEE